MFSPQSRLARAIPGFVPREPQSDLAEAIAKSIDDKSILVAEAGTGTGKTFAYLLPCLLSGKKTIISTATKTLQDQLFEKDLPALINALGLPTRVQNLKGRANYICRHRVTLHSEEGQFQSPQAAHEIALVRDKLAQMKRGERSELPELSEDSPVWYYVTSTTDNCLNSQCPDFDSCFLMKARRRAMKADIVVINHALFFADSQLKQGNLGELLPGAEVVIFDEAHQLAEIAVHFNDDQISTRQFNDVIQDMINEWPAIDLANQPLKTLKHEADKLVEALVKTMSSGEDRQRFDKAWSNKEFSLLWNQWIALKEKVLECLTKEHCDEVPGLQRAKERLEEFSLNMQLFSNGTKEKILWIERFKQTLAFHATPYDVAKSFSALLAQHSCAYVFTSATLTMASSFDCFCKSLGLNQVVTLMLPSPFNYQTQALLYLPRGLPDPKNEDYYNCLVKKAITVIEACGGRCFFLFTSHKALKLVAKILANTLKYPLLIQGNEAKPILLARFRELGNAVLLGTSTFWEGVDVKGEALSCVIIDKLPFTSPSDPVTEGRMEYFKKQGLSAFNELSLPQAVIALKQGVGRLIRDISDKGVLMIADPRLTSRDYGRIILNSLPPLPKTREEEKVLNFIRELALEPIENEHEPVSD